MALGCIFICLFQLLCYVVLAAVCCLVVLYFILKYNESIRSRLFVRLFSFGAPKMKPKLAPFKDQLFKDLDKVVSGVPELRKNGLFRILEIGIANGINLHYYPTNCRLVSVEPNDYFKKRYEENQEKFPGLVVERHLTGVAEDMKDVADESVDVVVCTHVLCSVTDMKQVFKEVKRVLCKDGQFILLEHITAEENTTLHKIHHAIDPLWVVFFAGCHLNRKTDHLLREAGFSKVEIETVEIPGLYALIRRHMFGRAIK